MNTPSSALSDEMKGAMSTLLNAVIFEQWLRFSWIEEDEEGDFCIQIPAETVSELVEDYPEYEGLIAQLNGTIVDADMACSAVLGYARSSLGEPSERAVWAGLAQGGSDVPALLFWAAGKSQAALVRSGPDLENMAGWCPCFSTVWGKERIRLTERFYLPQSERRGPASASASRGMSTTCGPAAHGAT